MDFTQWRGKFFNVSTQGSTSNNTVIGQAHSGHPHGVPRITQGLKLRTTQPHEVGFINSNSNINKRFLDGVDTGNFQVTTPQTPPAHNDLIPSPIGVSRIYATPSTRSIQQAIPSRPGISGGGSGVQH